MAAITRQPFAPLNEARLQSLTSMKNRQNAIASPKGKRKAADSIESDDSENVDPVQFVKRSKAGDSFFSKDMLKPSGFVLTKAASTPSLPPAKDIALNSLTAPAPRPRTLLQPKSPAARLNTSFAKGAPLSAPAGRSPTRGSKRVGLLSNRRRTGGSFGRVDPPAFGLANAAPFSLDAALKGTIPSYASRAPAVTAPAAPTVELNEPAMQSSWFFDIHEDTPEQEMTNLLQHSTCTLDISSDEESEQRARREKAEGRDKENIPPADDVSQTTRIAAARAEGPIADEMVVEKSRDPLGALNVEDFYAKGCDAASVILIPEDEEDEAPAACVEKVVLPAEPQIESSIPQDFDFTLEVKHEERSVKDVVDGVEPAIGAALLQPMEGTGESFELWESGSAKDAVSAPPSPRPVEEPIEEAATVAV